MKLARAPAIATLVVALSALAVAAPAVASDPPSSSKATATVSDESSSAIIESVRGTADYLSAATTPQEEVGDYISRHTPAASAPSRLGGADIIESVRSRPDHLSPTSEVPPVAVAPGGGIDWTDVAIGIGIGLATALLVAWAVSVMRHPPRRHPPTRPPAALTR